MERDAHDTESPWPIATLGPDMAGTDLPGSVSCHTSLYFVEPEPEKCEACKQAECEDDEADAGKEDCRCEELQEKNVYPWQVIYARDDKPVLIERAVGKGTIVLSALSYFVSNEAMRKERHTGLLLWLGGGKEHIVFDELHHGIMKQRGVASLMRKYRLQWLGAGLLLLAILFIWKNSVGLVPADESLYGALDAPVAKGKDSAAGLTNLLRRNLGRRDVLRTCLREYRGSVGRPDNRTRNKLDRITRLVKQDEERPARERNSVKAYNEICKILDEQ